MTFSLNNKSTPHKHIPPTADAILVSLNWLGPGHTFRTSYGAKSDAPAKQHIITLDTKSSMATYIAPDHPFPSFDRNQQRAYVLCLPRWDEDASGEGNKSLTVVGDISSVDLEVLGNIGNTWHRQSQENPLTLPLDKAMDDTMLLALDIDLIDTTTGTPVMYAYLNDGTLQGWQVKHSKPYIGMVSAQGLAPTFSQSSDQSQESGPKDSDMSGLSSTNEASPFGQSLGNNTLFGQQTTSSFGQQQSSSFGQSPFGQQPSQNASVFGQSPFGQLTSSAPSAFSPSSSFGAFGNGVFGSGSSSGGAFSNLNSGTTNVFGQGSFGANNIDSGNVAIPQSSDMTREASMSDSTDSFGGMSLGSATSTTSNAVNSMFGTFATAPVDTPTQSAFGGIVRPATGFGASNNLKPGNSFELNKPVPTTSTFSAAPQAPVSSGFGQSGFASPAFGKSSFGQPTFGKSSLGITPATSASGFATFANTPSTFGSPPTPAVFGSPETRPASGFNAFASGSTTFGSALDVSKSADDKKDSGGAFSSFVSNTPTGFSAFVAANPSPFGATPVASTTPENTPKASASAGGFTSFASSSPTTFGTALKASESPARTTVFGTPVESKSSAESPFASPTLKSTFGDSALIRNTTNTPGGSPQSTLAISAPSSPELGVRTSSSPFANDTPSTPPALSLNAFSNIHMSPSAFKPAAGFGAFGSAVTPPTSPFFKKPDDKPPVSAFGSLLPQRTSSTTPVSTPTFGSPSALGGQKSVFAPASSPSPNVLKPTTSEGFGAFSGSMGGFSAFAGPKKSFSELLKTGDPDPVKPSTPLAFSTPSFKNASEGETTPKVVSPISVSPSASSSKKEDAKDDKQKTPKSVFSVLSAPVGDVDATSNATVPDDDDKKQASGTISDEPSYGIISGSSAASSFVDIKADRESDDDAEEDADDGGEDGVNAFLSDDASSDGSYEDQESAEESSATEDSEANDSPPLEPAAIPLPISRSPSATPQPEIPTIEVSPSPPSEEKSYRSSSLSPARESSTTPPGTPAKVSKPLFDSSSSPTGNAPFPSPSGIGLGRPSTRPARSSPLANAVLLSGHDEDEEDKAKPSQPPAVAPKSVFNTFPVKVESSEGQSPTDRRPKTPPLLSTMGGTSFFASSSSGDASSTPVKSPRVDAPVPFNFQKSPAGSSEASTVSLESSKVNAPVPFNFQKSPAGSSDASTAPVESLKVNSPVPFNFQKPPAMASPSMFGNSPQVPISGPSLFPPMSALPRPASAPTPTHSTFFGIPPPASSPNAFVFNIPPVKPQTSTTSIPLTSAPQGLAVIKPSLFPPNPKSTSGASPSMGSPSFSAAPSQPAPSSQLKAPPAGLFASSPAFSGPQKPPAERSAQVTLEEGMQKECIFSVSSADKELEEVGIQNFLFRCALHLTWTYLLIVGCGYQ